MAFEDILSKYFPVFYTEIDFVKKTYDALKKYGFTYENTISSVCICRDEISQSIRSVIKHIWGEAFNLSSLAGMFFAGKTGLMAAMHHAPIVDGKERDVFYAMPHIAIDEEGRIGVCKRTGREGESSACGALNAFQKELSSKKNVIARSVNDEAIPISEIASPLARNDSLKTFSEQFDTDDIEMSLIRMRLIKEIPSGRIPDLLELTKIAQKVIQTDLENTLKKVVDTDKSNYAVITGIQIHGPDANYVWPAECYAVVNGEKKEILICHSELVSESQGF